MTRRRRRPAAAVLMLAAALAAPLAAPADESPDSRINTEITRVSPSEGVTVTLTQPVVAHLPPLLTLRNDTGATIELHDESGTPFLRVGPGGSEGNARSPFYGPATRPNDPPPPSPGGPEPLWTRHGAGTTVRWYDRRAAYDGHGPSDRSKPATLKLFTIPGRIRDSAFAIDGSVTWKPVRGRVEAVLSSVTPHTDGVAVRILPGTVPLIELRNDSRRTIEILGRDGLPFARTGPDGIDVDENSPTWRDTRSQPEASPRTPAWRAQSARVLIWLERRAAYDGDPPESVQSARRVAMLGRWEVPGTIDGEPFAINGETRWVPSAEASGTRPGDAPAGSGRAWWLWPAAGAGAAVAAATAVVALRRRRAS